MINFKHLHYFWMVAKQGSITKASEHLHITPQTISGQISLLEEQLGKDLFSKVGRNLALTSTGHMVLSYADEIFSLGSELEQSVRIASTDRTQLLRVGIADSIPKSIAYRLLAPAMALEDPVRLVCKENSLEDLLGELALHKLDLIIADGPIPAHLSVRGFNHFLGECGTSFMAAPKLIEQGEADFPKSLIGAPFLIPSDQSLIQIQLLQWLEKHHIHPKIMGEFDDRALMKTFGQAGAGVFIVPSAIASEVAKQFQVEIIGSSEEIREQFFAIATEQRLSNPALVAITDAAKGWLKRK
ncbi:MULTISPECIES: transcriptional activator NhaR [Marinomonas]|uniref:Transcriptional activator NhaR n=1 Tax=Marinomonas arctica TaxID=383750 RepID=A0A7H1J852_9GAMM|nr:MULTISPECIES: transcriptional activator NhaR [Marinomonas]MCS7486686.1 LysR family transcriptional regulator [Marinomonas sp. BSi20414]QNT06668.1 transcriptional activator NhaR [Marinomonas arctica]GGN22621.1 transcriptional activator NhaR [Marinomonas arctica]